MVGRWLERSHICLTAATFTVSSSPVDPNIQLKPSTQAFHPLHGDDEPAVAETVARLRQGLWQGETGAALAIAEGLVEQVAGAGRPAR